VDLGSSTITITDTTAGSKFGYYHLTSGLTWDAGTSAIILTNSGVNAQTFAGGGLTYNNVTVQGAGAYNLTVTGNNNFNTFTVDASAAAKTIVATGTTQTVRNFVRDIGNKVITLTGGTWTKTGGGRINLNYMSISGVTVNPSGMWYAGASSTNGGSNVGWQWCNGPSPGGGHWILARHRRREVTA